MTPLAELAALAAEKVPGFVRPTCGMCAGEGNVREDDALAPCVADHPDAMRCPTCDTTGFDNSPAALAMAVLVYLRWCRGDYEVVGPLLSVSVYHVAGAAPFKRGCAVIKGDIPNYVAHAYLTALLRAHGVEVPNG